MDFSKRKDILFLGGFGHTPNLDAVKWFCHDIWPLIEAKNLGAKFIIAGSNPPDEVIEMASDSIIIKGFVSDDELLDLYKNVKINVVPLRFGAGLKGKTVGALNNGLPIVSTGIGIEGMPGNYDHFLTPFDDAASFAAQVILLYTDEKLLQKASEDAADYINQYFTKDTAEKKMKSILQLE